MEFESPLPHNNNRLKPVPVAGFIFDQKNSANFMPTLNYRKPRIVKAKHGWYITYTYKVPNELKPVYNENWRRFKIIKDMNRYKGQDREQFAEWLCREITESLKNGFNPFTQVIEEVSQPVEDAPEAVTAANAFKMFLGAWGKRGLEDVSMSKYKKYVMRFADWLDGKKILYDDIKKIKAEHIEGFLNDSRKTYESSNREYNNAIGFLGTCFNFLVKKEVLTKSPVSGVTKLKTRSTKHRFYDTQNLHDITKALLASDPYTYLAAQTVYYLCIRSDKELKNFRIGGIHWEQNKILLDAEGTKGNSARYVPMDNNIKELFLQHGIDKYPGNYYVFGINGKPSAKPFGTGFFAKRFRKVRDAAGLDPLHTIYSFKHTRVCHLKSDNVSDADIMSLTGHKDFGSYAHYLRDLGMSADISKINKVSRKI